MHTHAVHAARTLRQRHPNAPPSAVLVALTLALYGDPDGANIRPGFDRIAEDTGLSPRGVANAVRWLEDVREIERVRDARRGRAAVFTYSLNGMH